MEDRLKAIEACAELGIYESGSASHHQDRFRLIHKLARLAQAEVVSRQGLAKWCVEVEDIHERSWNDSARAYDKTYRKALAESSVPQEWRDIVSLLVNRKSYAELWTWCQQQGVELGKA